MDDSYIRRYEDTDFITSIRAIAAILVIIIHTGAFSEYGALGRNITGSGKNGVNIFFVISGFAIASSLRTDTKYFAFLTRRLMRILPIYYFAIALFAIAIYHGIYYNWWQHEYGVDLDLYNILMHASLLSMFDYRIAASIIGVEWTIPIEIFWYLALPLLLIIPMSKRNVLVVLVLLLLLDAITQTITSATDTPRTWLPFSYGWQFYLGALAFNFRQTQNLRAHGSFASKALVIAFLFAISLNLGSAIIALITALFIATFQQKPNSMNTRILCSKPMLILGTISYSLYLFHMAFVQISTELFELEAGLLLFLSTFLMTCTASFLTYKFIERPTNNLGRSLVEGYRGKIPNA